MVCLVVVVFVYLYCYILHEIHIVGRTDGSDVVIDLTHRALIIGHPKGVPKSNSLVRTNLER